MDCKIDNSSIVLRLKEILRVKKWTKKKLEETSTVSVKTISRWEKNLNEPSLDKLELIVKATGCNIDWLLTGTGKMFAYQPPQGNAVNLNFENSSTGIVAGGDVVRSSATVNVNQQEGTISQPRGYAAYLISTMPEEKIEEAIAFLLKLKRT